MKAEQLRKSILQLAIQGKLVKQDPNDEPASVLLERIRAEKQRLIKEGKIKKDKGDSIIFKGDDNCHYEKIGSEVKNIDDEIPFETPDSWCFTRFSSLIHINGGYAFKSENYIDKENGVRVLRISDFNEDGFNQKRPVYHKYTPELKSFELEINDIIMCMTGGTVGKSYFVEELPEPMLVNQRVADIKISDNLNKKYFYYFILSPHIQKIIDESKNSTNDNISVALINSFVAPVPPLSEQARIVEEIERFEPLLAEYDRLEQQATKLDSEIYDKLKKSILQYAIQGKLVKQDESDEPASVLLERIRAEKKAQLGKKYVESYIYKGDDNCYYEHIGGKDVNITEEIPFDLPDSWEWSRLNELCFEISDIDHNMPKSVEKGVLFLSAKDLLNDGTINYTQNVKYISEQDYERLSTKSSPQKGDIIYSRIGACLGKARIVKEDIKFLVSYSCCTVKPLLINTEYLRYILDDTFVLNQAKKKTQSIGVPDLGMAEIKKFRIPIPPLAEQKRIVDKINEIFAKL